jgi:signal transduction histidine kinase
VVGLRPVDLAGDGLDVALRKQAELLDRVHGAAVRFAGDAIPRLAPVAEEAAYRVAQEALHNALRHGAPSTVEVRLGVSDGTVRLEVYDDGRGFDPAVSSGAGARLGLASMRDRARAAGGRLEVRSAPGGGTTVRLVLPVVADA